MGLPMETRMRHDTRNDTTEIGAATPGRAHLERGAVVRTRRAWAGGIHRARVARVVRRDGEIWAEGIGWAFPLAELEVVRPAVR